MQDKTVAEVYRGYPAYNANIMVGDEIMEVNGNSILGAVGTQVTIIVNRNGNEHQISLIRDKICYKKD